MDGYIHWTLKIKISYSFVCLLDFLDKVEPLTASRPAPTVKPRSISALSRQEYTQSPDICATFSHPNFDLLTFTSKNTVDQGEMGLCRPLIMRLQVP